MEKKEKKQKSILYVEDANEVRKAYEGFFKKRFERVYVADNGQIGLDFFYKHKMDLIITDLNMPVMGGIEMCREIRKNNQVVPIIILTALPQESVDKDMKELNINHFFSKPVMIQKLLQDLSDLLPD